MKTADFLSLIFVGDDQDSEKSKPAGSDGEAAGVRDSGMRRMNMAELTNSERRPTTAVGNSPFH